MRELFEELPKGLRKRAPGAREAPFTILTPSFGRSALDEEAGLLDLSATLVDSEGEPLKYLQVVAVRPSEVEKCLGAANRLQ